MSETIPRSTVEQSDASVDQEFKNIIDGENWGEPESAPRGQVDTSTADTFEDIIGNQDWKGYDVQPQTPTAQGKERDVVATPGQNSETAQDTPGGYEEAERVERGNVSPEVHEILSGFQILRSEVRQDAYSVINTVQKGWAHTRNAAGMPNRLRHHMAKNRAEKRLNTAEDKFETAKQRYEEASELQDTSNSRIVNMWRDRKATRRYNTMKKREEKRDKRLKNLKSKESVYKLHVNTAQERLNDVDAKSLDRAKNIENKRKKLMEKRINAETRKLARVKERNNRLRERGEMNEQQRNLSYADRMSHAERENEIREKSQLSPEEIQALRVKATRNLQGRSALV